MTDRLEELEQRERIRARVARSARSLDACDFDGYIALFAEGAEYAMEVATPEIKRDSTWLRADRAELARLLSESSQHIHDLAARFHLVTVEEIDIERGKASSLSRFVVVRTDLQGRSHVYAVGTYEDEWIAGDESWMIARRTVRLQTRMMEAPTPMPL